MTLLIRLAQVCAHEVLSLTDYMKIFCLPLMHEVRASFLSGSGGLGFFVCLFLEATHVETSAGT